MSARRFVIRSVVRIASISFVVLAFAVSGARADQDSGKNGPDPKSKPPASLASGKEDKAARQALARRRASPPPRSLREAMFRLARIRVSVDFKEMEFVKVVEFIGNLARFNVIVGPELQAEGSGEIAPITLRLRDASLQQLAQLVERFSGSKMVVRKGILEFTTKTAARGKPVLRIFVVADITAPLRNFPGPDINLHGSEVEFEPEEESDVPSPFGEADNLASMIQEMVATDTWADDDVSISAYPGKLVVRQYPEVQRKIAIFLMKLRGAR